MATIQSGVARAASRPQPKVAAGSISSLRVKPFTRATRSVLGSAPRQQNVVPRAAEPEVAAVEADDYAFSLSDAKKGNEYSAGDVEAALRFYSGEASAVGATNDEFVENVFGIEDADFFGDLDNNEAYDDEFIAAGIPEAAPKQRQGGKRGGEGEGAEDSDEIAAAKEAEAMKQIEEQMVLEAELQETGLDKEEEGNYKAVGPAVWDWMSDIAAEDDDEEISAVASGGARSMAADVMAALPSDEEVFSDLRNANLQDVDVETRDTIEFLLEDFDIENEVKAIPDNVEEVFSVPEFAGLGDADVARIDALLGADISLPELDLSGPGRGGD
jgi:hypothetical protein